MEWKRMVKRNSEVNLRFREAQNMYLEYRRAYRRWIVAFHKNNSTQLKGLEIERDSCARKASKACHEAGRTLNVLAWWWTFGE